MWKYSPVPFLKGDHPLVMAHRGDSAKYPENSLPALEEAYALNVDVLETDLRITKDNDIIIFHDARVNRTTNGKGKVKRYTLSELKRLEQGYNFEQRTLNGVNYPFRDKGLEVQSVEEVLTKFPDVKFNMDIKDRDKRAPRILAKMLHENNAEDRVMVGSFHHKQIERFRLLSAAPTSASTLEVWKFRRKVKKWLKENPKKIFEKHTIITQEEILEETVPYFALQIPEKFAFLQVFDSAEFIEVCHKLNIAVHVWTINDPEDMNRLLDWNVDGIFSDKPLLLKEIIKSKFENGNF